MNQLESIYFTSTYFNNKYFLTYDDNTKIIKKYSDKILFYPSPYDNYLTFKLNLTNRLIIRKKMIVKLFTKKFKDIPGFNDFVKNILIYIGYDPNDVYINCFHTQTSTIKY
jgi:hypothetical protein